MKPFLAKQKQPGNFVMLGFLIMIVICIISWQWFFSCDDYCISAQHEAEKLFDNGKLIAAIEHIDSMDALCHCERFTSGDEPPQHALIRTSLSILEKQQKTTAIKQIFMKARGPILLIFAKYDKKQNPMKQDQ